MKKTHFADEIRQSILSFGILLEAGWGIDGQEKTLRIGLQVKIPVEMQHKDLIVQAKIRKMQAWKRRNGLIGWVKYGNKRIGIQMSTNH